jgi:hypothetical protein
MGWKNIKERFGIEHHVQVTATGVCIGSGYISELVTIDSATGAVKANEAYGSFLKEHYPALLEAAPDELVRLIAEPDTFSAAIVVYTYDGAEIVEKTCDKPGWPNVTHDGCMMYENSFSTDKSVVVGWAKNSAAIAVEGMRRRIAEVELELIRLNERLAGYEADQAKLAAAYPDVDLSPN